MAKVGNQAEMPFLDHLEELRWRIMWSLVALVVCVVVSFVVLLRYDAIKWLALPILPYVPNGRVITTHPAGAFKIVMTASFALGGVLSSPVLFYHLWAFLSPALHKHEKRVLIPVLVFGAMLFLSGVALAFFGLIPLTLRFLLGVQSSVITPLISANEYFGFAIGFSLVMGAVFEMPIVILALTGLGLVTPKMLTRYRRHAFVICLVASAFITPGQDPLTLAAVFLPLIGLYEVSIICSHFIARRMERRQARLDAEAAEATGATT